MLVIIIFAVNLRWFPSVYDTTLVVDSWGAFRQQVMQMFLPVMVLALQITSQLSRFMRASMLDNLNQDYVRTAAGQGDGRDVGRARPRPAQLDDPGP